MPKVKLTDEQKKKIIADYVVNNNYSETARMNNVTDTTVKRIIMSEDNKEMLEKVEQKKDENTQNILDYIDSNYSKQKEIIDLSMDALIKKLKKPDAFTNVKDIATVYGVIIDKSLKIKEVREKTSNNLDNRKTVIVDDLPKYE